MNVWYQAYESQCWYKNTFLVNSFDQISKVCKRNGEWNNVEGSGCHFVCLSMIAGINPARLSSALKELQFFKPDRSLRSKKLNGNGSFLVWDQNEPHETYKEITIKNVFLSAGRVVDISIEFIEIVKTNEIAEANKLIETHRSKGNHIICGHNDHSRLVAGMNDGKYYLWDPDLTDTNIEDNINGKYDLPWFYELYAKKKQFVNELAEYWIYSVRYSE